MHEQVEAAENVVAIEQSFVTHPDYLGANDEAGHCVLYPGVLDALVELCEGDHVEAVLSGSIGCGKTTLAIYCMADQLYRLLCYRDPRREFGLDPSSEILLVFQSLNAELGSAGPVPQARVGAWPAEAVTFSSE